VTPPRPLSLCRVNRFGAPREDELPHTVVLLGEIPNMPEHCVVVDASSGRVIVGLHLDRLVEVPEDET
jgi:hypothetical protein